MDQHTLISMSLGQSMQHLVRSDVVQDNGDGLRSVQSVDRDPATSALTEGGWWAQERQQLRNRPQGLLPFLISRCYFDPWWALKG
jgi:hypothetical protein